MLFRKLIVLGACLAAGQALAEPVLRWAPADTTVDLGQQVTLEIMLDDTLNVRTLEFTIDYDSDVLTTLDGGPGALFDGFNLFSGFEEVDPAEPGQQHGYCVILGANDWAVGPGPLFSWTLRGDHSGLADLITVTVRLLPPGGGDYAETVLPATSVVVNPSSGVTDSEESEARLTLFPNPFNPRTTIAWSGQATRDASLEVFDLQGRRLARLAAGSGNGQVSWDGRDGSGQPLPSGIYTFLLTSTDGQRITTRGTLLR